LEQTLLQRVGSGEASAVPEVLDRYGGLVWSLARRFCGDQSEAEDAVQEIFVDVWKSAGRFDPRVASEATFIATIARRRLIDRMRRRGRDPLAGSVDVDAASGAAAGVEPGDSGEDVSRAAAALERLPDDQRRVLKLSVYYGLSHEKIATATGLPLGTVKTHVRRGLIKIREALSEGESLEVAS
jgi:RNA polymerase sigma-70 factor, ECF subfamily